MLLADWHSLARAVKRSDGVIEVVDARDPLGTRSRRLEGIARAFNRPFILVLNKVDLVPKWDSKAWIDYFSSRGIRAVPVSAIRRKGKEELLKAMKEAVKERPATFVIAGYPKTGKSSIINMFKGYRSAPTSPVPGSPGYTRGYTIYKVSQNIYILDTPGTIPVEGDYLESVIRGRAPEELSDPVKPAVMLLERALTYNPNLALRAYGIAERDPYVILEMIARRRSWFYKSTGDPNIEEAARAVIRDYHKAKLWFFVPPPVNEARTG